MKSVLRYLCAGAIAGTLFISSASRNKKQTYTSEIVKATSEKPVAKAPKPPPKKPQTQKKSLRFPKQLDRLVTDLTEGYGTELAKQLRGESCIPKAFKGVHRELTAFNSALGYATAKRVYKEFAEQFKADYTDSDCDLEGLEAVLLYLSTSFKSEQHYEILTEELFAEKVPVILSPNLTGLIVKTLTDMPEKKREKKLQELCATQKQVFTTLFQGTAAIAQASQERNYPLVFVKEHYLNNTHQGLLCRRLLRAFPGDFSTVVNYAEDDGTPNLLTTANRFLDVLDYREVGLEPEASVAEVHALEDATSLICYAYIQNEGTHQCSQPFQYVDLFLANLRDLSQRTADEYAEGITYLLKSKVAEACDPPIYGLVQSIDMPVPGAVAMR